MMALCGGSASVPTRTDAGVAGFAAQTVSEEAVAQLVSLGLDFETARDALVATHGDVEAAANMLLG